MPSRRNRKNGGGWGVGPDYISPGNLVNHAYAGAGKDCAGIPMRSGYMDMYSKEGLPGFQGGNRNAHRRRSKRIQGGRYEVTPGAYLPANGIGASSPSFVSRLACESSRTAVPPMQGGMQMNPASYESSGSASNVPSVQVGASDSMKYEAPNAGYTNDFTTFRAGAVPGFTVQTPYNAGSFNQACLKTGGSHQMRDAAYAPVTFQMSQVGNRSAFDGTTGGLPVKFGGLRKHHHTKGCKHRKQRKRHNRRTKKRHTSRKH
jgi:hypothetical protein